MKKRFLSVFLALVLCLTLLPTAAFAADSVAYLDASGIETTCSDYTLLDSDYVSANKDADGNVTIGGDWYVVSSDVSIDGSLILAEGDDTVDIHLILCDGATLTAAGVDSQQGTTKNYDKITDLTIYGQSGGTGTLCSSGYIRSYSSYDISCGIYVCGTLTVYGGVIEATGRDMKENAADALSNGIYATALEVSGGTVSATGGKVSGMGENISRGIYTDYDLSVTGGALIAAGGDAASRAGGAESYGIYGMRSLTVKGGGSLTITGGDATATADNCNARSCGILTGHRMSVEGSGAVFVTGGDAGTDAGNALAYGLYVGDDMTVKTGGSVIVTGGDASADGGNAYTYGLLVEEHLTLQDDNGDESGGSLTVTGGDATATADGYAARAYGIYTDENMTVENGSSVSVIGGDATAAMAAYAFGLLVDVSFDVSYNSSVTAAGGDATADGAYSFGFYVYSLTVREGSLVNADSGDTDAGDNNAETYGIYAHRNMTVEVGSVVAATGGDATCSDDGGAWTYGIYYSGGNDDEDIMSVQSGSVVTATSGDAEADRGVAYTRGIYADGIVCVGNDDDDNDYNETSGSITATSGNAGSNGDQALTYGLYIDGELYVQDKSSVTATGGCAESDASLAESGGIGLYCLRVSGTAVVTGVSDAVTCSTGETYSNGISIWSEARISGGTVIATGNKANGSIRADYSADLYVIGAFDLSGGQVKSGRAGGAVSVYHNDSDPMAVSGGSIQLCGDGDYLRQFKAENGVKFADLLATGYAFYASEEDTTPIDVSSVDTLTDVFVKPHTCTFAENSYTCDCGRSYAMEPVSYLDENGGVRYCGDYTVLTAESGTTLGSGWYVVKGDTELESLPLGEGSDVHLILCDGAALTVGGINNERNNIYALTIYGQSTGDDMGTLSVSGSRIVCYGDLTINGGDIAVSNVRISEENYDAYAYGIYVSDDMTVNGGSLTVDGVSAASINGDAYAYGIYVSEDMTVNGGSITVRNVSASSQGDNQNTFARGIYIDEEDHDLIVNGGIITVEDISTNGGGNMIVYGIETEDGSIIVNGGSITVTGATYTTTSSGDNRGITSDEDLIVTGGTITINDAVVTSTAGCVESDALNVYNDLIMTGGKITVNGGSVTAPSAAARGLNCESILMTAGTIRAAGSDITVNSENKSCGIYVVGSGHTDGLVSITGGSITGIGGDVDGTAPYGYSNGIYVEDLKYHDGLLTITGGSVTGIGGSIGTADGYSCGIESEYMTVRNGSVTATGGNAEWDDDIYVCWDFDLIGGTVRSSRSGGAVRVYADPLTASGGSIRLRDCYLDGVRTLGRVKLADLLAEGYAYFAVYEDEEYEEHDIGFVVLDGQTSLWQVYVKPCQHSYTDGICGYCGGKQPSSDSDSAPTYAVTVSDTEHGTVKVSLRYAERGDTVTITVTPDSGYTLETLTVLDKNGKEIELTDKGDGKYTFKMPGGKVEVKATFAEDNSMLNFFVDVTADKYYYNAVLWAAKNGITGGIDENHFGPDLSCTRAQLVTFLWRAVGCPVVNYAMDFSDVGNGYYTEAVRWAASLGIVGGYGNGLFGSDDAITREQFVTILYRFAVAMGYDVSVGEDTNILSYNDVFEVSEYAIPAFQWATGAGVVQGNDGNLMPKASCTRAQIVTMLYRLLGQ